jgi:Na+/pantothenate symporter
MAIFSRRRYSWLYIIWVIIGLIVAWERSYITVYLVKLVLSALLAIFLWPLVLLGISLHIH